MIIIMVYATLGSKVFTTDNRIWSDKGLASSPGSLCAGGGEPGTH